MIGIVVGVNLISPVNNVVQTVTTPTYASSVVSLTGVLPIIFVTVIILGAIAWLISAPSKRNLSRRMSQTLGSLRQLVCYGNQELNQSLVLCKCVENRGFTSCSGSGRWYVPTLRESGESIQHRMRERDGLQGLASYTNIWERCKHRGEEQFSPLLPF